MNCKLQHQPLSRYLSLSGEATQSLREPSNLSERPANLSERCSHNAPRSHKTSQEKSFLSNWILSLSLKNPRWSPTMFKFVECIILAEQVHFVNVKSSRISDTKLVPVCNGVYSLIIFKQKEFYARYCIITHRQTIVGTLDVQFSTQTSFIYLAMLVLYQGKGAKLLT